MPEIIWEGLSMTEDLANNKLREKEKTTFSLLYIRYLSSNQKPKNPS